MARGDPTTMRNAEADPLRTVRGDQRRQLLAATATRDAVVAGLVAAVGAAISGTMAAALTVGVPTVTALLVATEAVPLLWRRRAPVAVLAGTLALTMIVAVVPDAAFSPLLATVVATYTVAAHRRGAITVAAGSVVAIGAPLALRGLLDAPFPFYVSVVPDDHLANDVVGSLLVLGGAAALGASLRARRAHTARVEEHAARLERDRAERERQVVIEERARIARELHDVAAHHLSGLVLQAGALERTADHDPDHVRELAGEVREGGATALASMRRLVGLLRAADEQPIGRGSQPALADVDGLVEAAQRDGLDVQLDVDDALTGGCDVPDEVGLAAYRIVQESLSNTRRHAPGARAHVCVERDDGCLTVEVTDDGGHAPLLPSADGEPGHGLIGMRERVALLNGEFRAGPRRPSGWRVCATLPTGDGEEPA